MQALLLTLGCATALAAPACASAPLARIAPASLVVPRKDLPGFTAAVVRLITTSSAHYYDQDKAAALKRDGFQEGVLEDLEMTGLRQGATSEAAVFRTARGAAQAFRAEVAEVLMPPTAEVRFTVPGIPGSLAIREMNLGDPPGYIQNADISFSTGRCLEDVAVSSFTRKPDSTTRQVDGAAVSGASALYRRVKRICA
ncbi:MAG TPA: hypothetical protein VKG38_15705 [Solirubrobacteraceae bacterium]|nr:hypothetical protein [Solirubrobacteraceae bacterium]